MGGRPIRQAASARSERGIDALFPERYVTNCGAEKRVWYPPVDRHSFDGPMGTLPY